MSSRRSRFLRSTETEHWRISLGYDTTEAEVVRAAAIIPAAVRAVRDAIGVGATP